VSIEEVVEEGALAEPICTISRELTPARREHSPAESALFVSLDASTTISITGRRYVHAFLMHQFDKGDTSNPLDESTPQRSLAAVGYFAVNSAGSLSRPSYDSAHLHAQRRYCGRVVGQGGYHSSCGGGCDGRCGPSNGCQCRECFQLDTYTQSMRPGGLAGAVCPVRCPQGHELVLSTDVRPWICDATGEGRRGCLVAGREQRAELFAGQGRWRCCMQCDFDYCGACSAAKSGLSRVSEAVAVVSAPAPRLSLHVAARQFSSYVVMLGRMNSASSFDPKYAMIVKNKDHITIPLEIETIPSAKEFKEAISSLSPEQQRFAKAFRGMQLESTLFAVLVIQIKPQLEKVLNLPAGSLVKEIALQETLLSLFIDFQISSDLLAYTGIFYSL
jgi:hypothetical protein